MTSAEEVPRIPCSVGARQAEPPAPQNGLAYVFSRGRTSLQVAVTVPDGPCAGAAGLSGPALAGGIRTRDDNGMRASRPCFQNAARAPNRRKV